MKRLVLAVCVLTGVALGQNTPDILTGGYLNCRGWNRQDDSFRLRFVAGYSSIEDQVKPVGLVETAKALTNSTWGERVAGITSVCANPKNASLPVMFAQMLFAAKVRGDSEAQIEESAAKMRRSASPAK